MMGKMINSIYIDIDGTLCSFKDKSIPHSAVIALKKAQEKGIKICLSSGRHPLELERLDLQGLKFDGYILSNGQLVFDKDFQLIYDNPFSKESAAFIGDYFNQKKEPMSICTKDSMFMNCMNDEIRKTMEKIKLPQREVRDYHGEDIYLVGIYCDREHEQFFLDSMPEALITRWGDAGADLITKGNGKHKGIQAYRNYFGLNGGEIMCIGDSENDLTMLENADIAVVMGNGDDSVKAIADYVTASVEEDGIYKALLHYGLI